MFLRHLLVLLALLPTGCGKREDLRPAPTSSFTKDQATIDARGWVARSPTERSFCNVKGSGSMVPLFDSRSVLLLETVRGLSLVPGDIALYDDLKGGLVVHRVRQVGSTAVLFTGDNNDPLQPDGWIASERIRWRVAGILYSRR